MTTPPCGRRWTPRTRWCPCSASTTDCSRGRHASGPRTQFLLECLAELDAGLRDRGSRLLVRHGPPQRELPALAAETRRRRRCTSAPTSARSRVAASARSTTRSATTVAFHVHPGLFAVDRLDAIRTQGGGPYTVFTPFHRNWASQPRRDVLGAPRRLPALPPAGRPRRPARRSATSASTQECEDPAPGARARGASGCAASWPTPCAAIDEGRDQLAGDGGEPALALPALRLRLAARGGASPPRRRGRRGLSAPAVLA